MATQTRNDKVLQIANAAANAVKTTIIEAYSSEELKSSSDPAKDQFGFGVNSGASFIASGLISGSHTRKTLLDAFLGKFSDGTPIDQAKKRVSFYVFMSDIKREVGVYSVSRGFEIRVDDKGVMSVTKRSIEAARRN